MLQDSGMGDKRAEASATIGADADTLYDLVADLTQMGRWSPEACGGRWVGGATGPALGARFHGNNRSGWRRWSTSCRVIAADRGERFAFRVNFGPLPVSDWTYAFETDGGGTRVTESWVDLRPTVMEVVSRPVMGVSDRAVHNRRNMGATLAALKAAAENGGAQTAS
jgi:Polyketide cyclase / dehydrase and lipid transport